MPTFRDARILAISEVAANLMAGSQFEFLGRPSRVQVYAVADTGDTVDFEVFFGQELELSPAPINQVVAATGPTVPDDLLLDDVGAPGDRLGAVGGGPGCPSQRWASRWLRRVSPTPSAGTCSTRCWTSSRVATSGRASSSGPPYMQRTS